jgi:oxygen-dependent protoporphyrinogen oxidase
MERLTEALVQRLPQGVLRLGTQVVALRTPKAGDAPWSIELAGGERVLADAVLLTTPAWVTAGLVPDPKLGAELRAIPHGSTATVILAFDRERVAHPLDGSGFVVPHGQGRIQAATWVTSKWQHRAPPGKAVLRTYLGGTRDPSLLRTASDDDLVSLARSELERLMGSLGEPELTRVHRYVDCRPQPVPGHAARLERIRGRLDRLPRLELAGAAYDGVGIPDCVRQAEAAVSRLFERCARGSSVIPGELSG